MIDAIVDLIKVQLQSLNHPCWEQHSRTPCWLLAGLRLGPNSPGKKDAGARRLPLHRRPGAVTRPGSAEEDGPHPGPNTLLAVVLVVVMRLWLLHPCFQRRPCRLRKTQSSAGSSAACPTLLVVVMVLAEHGSSTPLLPLQLLILICGREVVEAIDLGRFGVDRRASKEPSVLLLLLVVVVQLSSDGAHLKLSDLAGRLIQELPSGFILGSRRRQRRGRHLRWASVAREPTPVRPLPEPRQGRLRRCREHPWLLVGGMAQVVVVGLSLTERGPSELASQLSKQLMIIILMVLVSAIRAHRRIQHAKRVKPEPVREEIKAALGLFLLVINSGEEVVVGEKVGGEPESRVVVISSSIHGGYLACIFPNFHNQQKNTVRER